MTKLIVVFRKFANASKKRCYIKADSTRGLKTRRSRRQLLSAFMYYLHSSVPTASVLTRAFEQRVLVVC